MSALPTELETVVAVECTVAGCGWRAELPVRYRLEPTLEPFAAFLSTRVVVDPDSAAAVDAYLAGHRCGHELVDGLPS